MSAPPNDPKDAAKREQSNAVLWAVLAAVFAAFMFVQAGKVEPEKQNFYRLAGAAGAILAAVNGYGAWTASQKAKK
jgi:hypothetical protein